MDNYEKFIHMGQPEYHQHFWNAMKGKDDAYQHLQVGRNQSTDAYEFPNPSLNRYNVALEKESIFRNLCSVMHAYGTKYSIYAKDCRDVAKWTPESDGIDVKEGFDDFTEQKIDSWKLATLVKFDVSFITNASFDTEKYLIERFAKNFSGAEDDAFINGTGASGNMPTGILADNEGAEVGITSADAKTITYDEVIRLYFSVKPEYRKNSVWLMNDETALLLRTLKDANGNYLWRNSDDTILGKKVVVSEFMPNAEKGKKPIAFGDFSYYWIVPRKPLSVKPLAEIFIDYNQIGYLAYEFIDGKLIRPEAIKVLKMAV